VRLEPGVRDGVNGGGFGAGFWLVFFDLIRHCDWEPGGRLLCACRRGPRTGPRRVRGLPAGRRPARGRPGFKWAVARGVLLLPSCVAPGTVDLVGTWGGVGDCGKIPRKLRPRERRPVSGAWDDGSRRRRGEPVLTRLMIVDSFFSSSFLHGSFSRSPLLFFFG